jgi:hypothetical protein
VSSADAAAKIIEAWLAKGSPMVVWVTSYWSLSTTDAPASGSPFGCVRRAVGPLRQASVGPILAIARLSSELRRNGAS